MWNAFCAKLTVQWLVAVLCLASVVTAAGAQSPQSRRFPGSASIVEGVVTTKSGRLLPHATIYLVDIPPSQGRTDAIGDTITVTTDDKGHFVWNVPDRIVILPDGKNLPACWAMAADRSTCQFDLRLPQRSNERRQLLESAVAKCETKWMPQAANPADSATPPFLSVVAPDVGLVHLTIREPDGRLLRSHAVDVYTPGTWFDAIGAVVYSTRTDDSGRLSMRWFPDLYRMQVLAPGVGFGSTGRFEVLPGTETSPAIPPLAAFGRVSGSFASRGASRAATGTAVLASLHSLPDDAIVTTDDYWSLEHRWYHPTSSVDGSGHWTLNDVLPGEHRIVVRSAGSVAAEAESDVTVRAGETVSDVLLAPAGSTPPRTTHSVRAGGEPERQSAAANGIITDTAGRFVGGAAVYAICSYSGMRMNQQVLKATTDEKGKYRIEGIPFGSDGYTTVQLIATQVGYGFAQAGGRAGRTSSTADVQADLVLPAATTGLTVTVLHSGKPVANATVRLTQGDNSGLTYPGYIGTIAGAERNEVERFLAPSGRTGSDGRATFGTLSPGLWTVTASEANAEGTAPLGSYTIASARDASATARDVAVGAGKTTDFSLNIYPHVERIALKVIGPDGQPPAHSPIGFGLGPASSAAWVGGGASLTLDSDGSGFYDRPQSGLWRVATTFRDVAVKSLPANDEPRYTGEAIVAVSPSVAPPGPVVIRAARRGPGVIRARVLGADGKAVLGATVVIGDTIESVRYGGSTDSNGDIEFPDMPSGSYTLSASAPGVPEAPRLGRVGDPVPTDKELDGVFRIAPQTVTVRPDDETKVTLRSEPQGYIRGKLLVDVRLGDFALYSPVENRSGGGGPLVRMNPATGDFVAGPFPRGKTQLILYASNSAGEGSIWWHSDIDIAPGRVSQAILSPEGLPGVPVNGVQIMAKASTAPSYFDSPLSGSVFMPDGVTPAFGALVGVCVPHSETPVLMSLADASGRLSKYSSWYGRNESNHAWPGPVVDDRLEPVVVAWLPGSNGATVVPYVRGEPLRIVLPAARSVRGRITLGGRSLIGADSSFRVFAEYQGKGRLNRILSVQAVPQVDGSFVLAGLTPGVYRVQAARDEIWVSEAQTITVGEGSSEGLALDIPSAGQTMDLRLIDSAGKPLRGARVSIARPDGPLTTAIWPTTFTSDSTGCLHLEGLVAGQETVTVYGASEDSAETGHEAAAPIAKAALDIPEYMPGRSAVVKVITAGR